MKQTAVEWLFEQIDNRDRGEIPMWIYNFYYEAKEMEEEQIKQAYNDGKAAVIHIENNMSLDEYYNEIFKNETK